jgi:hypothetical protein
MGRSLQHSWDSMHPDPEVNMRCSKCGMEQKPEYRGSCKNYYRRPGGLWAYCKLVPVCLASETQVPLMYDNVVGNKLIYI